MDEASNLWAELRISPSKTVAASVVAFLACCAGPSVRLDNPGALAERTGVDCVGGEMPQWRSLRRAVELETGAATSDVKPLIWYRAAPGQSDFVLVWARTTTSDGVVHFHLLHFYATGESWRLPVFANADMGRPDYVHLRDARPIDPSDAEAFHILGLEPHDRMSPFIVEADYEPWTRVLCRSGQDLYPQHLDLQRGVGEDEERRIRLRCVGPREVMMLNQTRP